ncbi:SDR family NAD(P)-dependent oxidoreductase [Amycolatopsis sp. FDAARGOS 1241]|uniref:SDR family NAD(P)-dependent oxidoreductase n=1 Tax=Amycolatopsis sp. FDAARGOS 1241 TaxID=2778070 RepID=UPI001EF304D8|nr:SDR family NAD(P)-dependent oxidoreductase [Amycolatopsis sp. FDAARGOS 1241]
MTFGGIDVLVNNAGHMLVGAIEEVDEEQARAQMDVNYFGALWATRVVLPGMRERRAGRILQVSSLGGLVAYPALGIFQASKWALEAMSESRAAEVAAYGIHVPLIEPVMFTTGRAAASPQARQQPAYAHARQALYADAGAGGLTPGDPAATAEALLALVETPEPGWSSGTTRAPRAGKAGRIMNCSDRHADARRIPTDGKYCSPADGSVPLPGADLAQTAEGAANPYCSRAPSRRGNQAAG